MLSKFLYTLHDEMAVALGLCGVFPNQEFTEHLSRFGIWTKVMSENERLYKRLQTIREVVSRLSRPLLRLNYQTIFRMDIKS